MGVKSAYDSLMRIPYHRYREITSQEAVLSLLKQTERQVERGGQVVEAELTLLEFQRDVNAARAV